MEEVRYREAVGADLPFLATMLGEAAVWRPDKPTPTGDEAMADPRYAMYLTGWPRAGDVGVIAEQGEPLGAAWARTYSEAEHGHGYVADDVPEVSIAVVSHRRREGIGRQLLLALIDASVAHGHRSLSLRVREQNPARLLYESVGFTRLADDDGAWTMVRTAPPPG